MSEEAFERLLGELRRIADKVDALDGRLRGLEETERAAEPPTQAEAVQPTPPPEREGGFGPSVRRSDPSKHRKAVSTALAMLGVIPESRKQEEAAAQPESLPKTRSKQKHAKALERIRQMQDGVEQTPSAEPQTAETGAEPVAAVAVAEAPTSDDKTGKPAREPPANQSAPGVRWEVAPLATGGSSAGAIDLSAAVAVDLTRADLSDRKRGLLLIVPELVAAALIITVLSPWASIPALILVLCALVAPIWGLNSRIMRAHARFFTLLLLARCLMPDFLFAQFDSAWTNPRFAAMGIATIPAWVLVVTGQLGWGLSALLMSIVGGVAVGLESGSMAAALFAIVATSATAILVRRTYQDAV